MKNTLTYFLLFLFLSSCKTGYFVSAVSDDQQKFDASYTEQDAAIEEEILLYRIELEASMNDVIAVSGKDLVKAKPESTLGNLLADATLIMAEQYANTKLDIGILNYGGIRVPSINKGDVTLGNIYELMPFDNYLVIMDLKGDVLLEVCQAIAEGGGWPVSGLQFKIQEGKAINVFVNHEALDLNKVYKVAISDYLAGGGDNLAMLKDLPIYNTNVLLRDAFIGYFEMIASEGQLLDANIEGRITNE